MGDVLQNLLTDGGGKVIPQSYNSNPSTPGFQKRDVHDPAVTDWTLDASDIALLKGLAKILQGGGVGALPAALTSSTIPDAQPVPTKLTGSKVTDATTMQSAAAATGNGTVLDVTNMATAILTVTGTFVATIAWEGTADGTNWGPLTATAIGDGSLATTATVPGLYALTVVGLKSVRARISVYTSGSVTVTGVASPTNRSNKAINIAGGNLMPVVTTLTTTPLAAGGSGSSAVIDLTAAPGYGLAEIVVTCDQVTQIDVAFDDGIRGLSTTASQLRAAIQPGAAPQQIIPAFRPMGQRMQIFWSNPTATPQTTLRIYLLRYPYTSIAPHNLRALLLYNLAIRDTSAHNYSSDAGFGFIFTRIALGGGKVPVFVSNTHDQAVSVSVQLTIRGTLYTALGSTSVPASSKKVITNADFAGIDVPFEGMFLTATASVAPTTGVLSAWVDSLVGSGA